MREEHGGEQLSAQQAAVADEGIKAMIPIGRPFLDYVISALADAGFTEACIVIGPEHGKVRQHYDSIAPRRIRVTYAIQPEPRGTADAVLAAESVVGDEPFAVLNSDNYYPTSALNTLFGLNEPAIVAFERETLVREGNAPRDQIARFGALEVDDTGFLRRIVGDPERAAASTGGRLYASMNCWLFTRDIFRACREVPLSVRGEYELTQAVQFAIDRHGARFRVVFSSAPVLDLSRRADIVKVAERLSLAKVVL
jgi:dTDP-glucose pyrophosphorylase